MRRHSGLRRRLTFTLVGVALVSVILLSGVNYVFARMLLSDSVESQLSALRDTRIQAVERGVDRLEASVSALAANPSVVNALADLSTEYQRLEEDIPSDQISGLEALYETEILPPFVEAGVEISSSDLVPTSAAGRYLQQKYIVENPAGFDERESLDDAGDGSGYSAAHATQHPLLLALMDNARMSDLLLIDVNTRDVVYSAKKRIDIGTNVATGPYADSGLGDVVADLTTVAVGDSLISDSWFYIPTRGGQVFFLAAAVRSGSEVIGAVVTEVPAEVLTAVITAGQDWEQLGLGETGESYVVGSDRTLRSNSRAWLEDRDAYLRRYVDRYGDQEMADLIETVGSPVLLQQVDNAAVSAGLDGDDFVGRVTNYLGTKTLAASGPIDTGGPDWVVVVEQARSETDSAVGSMLRSILLVVAVLIPLIALLGWMIARNLVKPVDSLVRAAARIAGGDLDTEVDDLGRNELGDLGRQLEGVARQLESKEKAILDEERHINEVLMAILPARLVDRVRQGEEAIQDIFDTATIISITVDDLPEAAGADQDLVLDITERLSDEADNLMATHGVERIRRSSASQLFVTGLGRPDAQVERAAIFAMAAVEKVAVVGTEFGQSLTARAGLSAGDVATGVLGGNQLSFGVWGDPASTAVTLGSLARPGEILADANVVNGLGGEWDVGPAEQVPGLADDIDAYLIGGRLTEINPVSPIETI